MAAINSGFSTSAYKDTSTDNIDIVTSIGNNTAGTIGYMYVGQLLIQFSLAPVSASSPVFAVPYTASPYGVFVTSIGNTTASVSNVSKTGFTISNSGSVYWFAIGLYG